MARDFQFAPTVLGVPLGGGAGTLTADTAQTLTATTFTEGTVYRYGAVTVSASTTLGAAPVVVASPGAAAAVLTLPPAAGAVGSRLTIVNTSPTWQAVLHPAPGDLLNGSSADLCIQPGGWAHLLAVDPASWITLGPPHIPGQALAHVSYYNGTNTIVSGTAVVFNGVIGPPVQPGLHSLVTNPSRLTPTSPGYYRFSGKVEHGTVSTYTPIFARLYKNGALASAVSNFYGMSPGGTNSASVPFDEVIYCDGASDYVELYAGNTLNGNFVASGTTLAVCHA